MTKTILFICTGNYYRSRYAELLFNFYAKEYDLSWRAESRGIEASECRNPGPISPTVVERLEAIGVTLAEDIRYPLQLTPHDLLKSNLAVALKEEEHRPLLGKNFPKWKNRVLYWRIHDMNIESPEIALPKIDSNIQALVQKLGFTAWKFDRFPKDKIPSHPQARAV